jgi:hypothetical protein
MTAGSADIASSGFDTAYHDRSWFSAHGLHILHRVAVGKLYNGWFFG